jgi:hypothetical protein
MEVFVLVLLARVLNSEGWTEHHPTTIARGGPSLALVRGTDSSELTWNFDGTFTIAGSLFERPLRIVPLLARLDAETESEGLTAAASFPASRSNGGTASIVVVYPGDRTVRASIPEWQQASYVGLHPIEIDKSIVQLVPASPFALDSEERLARLLRLRMWPRRYAQYPPTLSFPPALQKRVLDSVPAKLRAHGDKIDVLRPLTAQEAQAIRLAATVDPSPPRKHARPKDAPVAKPSADSALAAAAAVFLCLETCPVCGENSDPGHLQTGDSGFFCYECVNCRALWGMRLCAECGHRYPFISPRLAEDHHLPSDPDAAERAFGRDLLAQPCPMSPTADDFICSHCGSCPNRDGEGAQSCYRCREVRPA